MLAELLSLEDVVRNIALPAVDVPVGMADGVVPDHWIHANIAGLHRWIPRAPMAWTFGVISRTPGPTPLRHGAPGSAWAAPCASAKPAVATPRDISAPAAIRFNICVVPTVFLTLSTGA